MPQAQSCTINRSGSQEAGQPFNVTTIVTYQDPGAAAAVWGASGRAYYRVDGGASVTGGGTSGSSVTGSFTVPGQPAGYHTVYGGVTGSQIPNTNETCSRSITIGYEPYFSVLGGDIAAGPGFTAADGSCTEGTGAAIKGWNRDGSGGSYYGSGSWLGALALGPITSFASQTNQLTGHGPNNPTGLTFANTTGSSPTYGGSFDKGNWCVSDYFTKSQDNFKGSPQSPNPAVDVSSLASGTYEYNGSSGFYASQPIPAGRQITILVENGNALIGSQAHPTITYAPYSLSNIPRLQVIVKGGSIIIDSHVSELHGLYVAEGNGSSSGVVYTCASGGVVTHDYNTCNSQLTIYGAVSTTRLSLDRSFGSLHASGGTTDQPAERLIYTPALWLANLKGPNEGTLPYQAATSLPPVL